MFPLSFNAVAFATIASTVIAQTYPLNCMGLQGKFPTYSVQGSNYEFVWTFTPATSGYNARPSNLKNGECTWLDRQVDDARHHPEPHQICYSVPAQSLTAITHNGNLLEGLSYSGYAGQPEKNVVASLISLGKAGTLNQFIVANDRKGCLRIPSPGLVQPPPPKTTTKRVTTTSKKPTPTGQPGGGGCTDVIQDVCGLTYCAGEDECGAQYKCGDCCSSSPLGCGCPATEGSSFCN